MSYIFVISGLKSTRSCGLRGSFWNFNVYNLFIGDPPYHNFLVPSDDKKRDYFCRPHPQTIFQIRIPETNLIISFRKSSGPNIFASRTKPFPTSTRSPLIPFNIIPNCTITIDMIDLTISTYRMIRTTLPDHNVTSFLCCGSNDSNVIYANSFIPPL